MAFMIVLNGVHYRAENDFHGRAENGIHDRAENCVYDRVKMAFMNVRKNVVYERAENGDVYNRAE